MRKRVITNIICLLVILLFVYAGLIKGMDMGKFKSEVDQSPLLMAFSEWIIWMIPASELIIAGMLIFTRTRLVGLYAAFTLMIIFTMYIIAILNFAEHIPCSCGGVLEKISWKSHLVFNIFFVALAAIGVVFLSDESDINNINRQTKKI